MESLGSSLAYIWTYHKLINCHFVVLLTSWHTDRYTIGTGPAKIIFEPNKLCEPLRITLT